MKGSAELCKDESQWGACVVIMLYFLNSGDVTPYNPPKFDRRFGGICQGGISRVRYGSPKRHLIFVGLLCVVPQKIVLFTTTALGTFRFNNSEFLKNYVTNDFSLNT